MPATKSPSKTESQVPKAHPLFPAMSDREPTTNAIVVEGLDVHEMRGTLRGTPISYLTGGDAWAQPKSRLDVTRDLKKRTSHGRHPVAFEALCRDGDAWLTGSTDVYRSTDDGETWRVAAKASLENQIVSIVRHEGTLWIADSGGGIAYQNGKSWVPVTRPQAPKFAGFTASTELAHPIVALSRLKVAGGKLYALGQGLWQLDSSTKKASLVAASDVLLLDVDVTAAGTLLAVGMDQTLVRRSGTSTKTTRRVDSPAYVGIVALETGVLLVASDGPKPLSWSTDDGKTFLPLAQNLGLPAPTKPGTRVRLHLAAADGHGGAFVAGWRGYLARVAHDGLGPWTKGAKPMASKKSTPAKPETPRKRNAKEEAALLADITANPSDDAPRLVYADWLLEHGDARGEFIQIQCKLQRPIYGARGDAQDEYEDYEVPDDHLALEKREKELVKQMTASLAPLRKYFYQWAWRRGFLYEVKVNASLFAGAMALFAAHPIEKLSITGLKKRDLPALAKLDLGAVRWLDLSEQRLTAKDIPLICGKNYAKIESLFLWDNPIADGGAIALANQSHFTNLRELGLLECGIESPGIIAIAGSKILGKLEKLDIAENPFDDAAALALANTKTLKALQIVNVAWEPKKTFAKPTVAALAKRFEINDVLGWEPYN